MPPNPTPAKACASAGHNNGRPGSPHPPISASAAAATTPQTGSASCAATAKFPPACPCRTAKSNLPASPRKSSACGNVSAATIFSILTAKATCLFSLAGHFEVQAAFWGVKTEDWKFCGVYMPFERAKAACTLIWGSAGCFYHFDFNALYIGVSNRTPPPDNARRKFFGRREPCPAENTAVRVRRYGAEIGGAGGYGAWLVSKKLLKYGEFTGSGDVWGEGGRNSCLAKRQKVV